MPSKRQAGIAAVEFAIVMPVLIALLAFPIFFGRMFYHYTVIQKAAQSAAIYYASIPLSEMGEQLRSLEAKQVAESIINTQIANLNPGLGLNPTTVILCDGGACGPSKPQKISVHIHLRMYDDFFNDFTWQVVGAEGIRLDARVEIPYVGN